VIRLTLLRSIIPLTPLSLSTSLTPLTPIDQNWFRHDQGIKDQVSSTRIARYRDILDRIIFEFWFSWSCCLSYTKDHVGLIPIVSLTSSVSHCVLYSNSFSVEYCDLLVDRSKVCITLKSLQVCRGVRLTLYVLNESRKSELENYSIQNVSISGNTCRGNLLSDPYGHSLTDRDILVVPHFV
jgi:hypothetical protein